MILVKIYVGKNANPEIYRFETLPVTFGRAIENDVVINETSVSAHHAVLERNEEGDLRLRDLGSTNGLQYAGRPAPLIPLSQTTSVRIGSVWAEISDSEEPLESTVRMSLDDLATDTDWSHKNGVLVLLPIMLFQCAIVVLDDWMTKVRFETKTLISEMVAILIFVGFVSAGGALFSKVHRRRYQFYPIATLILLFIIGTSLRKTFEDLIAFNLHNRGLWEFLSSLFLALLTFGWLMGLGHLLFREVPWKRRLFFVASGLTAVVLSSFAFDYFDEDERIWMRGDTSYSYPIRSFSTPPGDLELVLDQIDKIEEHIEKDRDKIIRKEKETFSAN